MAPSSQNRIGRCFNCRLLVQPLGEQDETMEEKQQRVEHYENMQISAVLQPYPGDGQQPPAHNKRNSGTATAAAAAAAVGLDASDLELALTSVVAAGPAVGGEPQHCLVCVARRIPTTEKLASANPSAAGPVVEQFTTKLDVSGKIVAVDNTGVSPPYSSYLSKEALVSSSIQELCHPDDLATLTAHLQETMQSGSSLSSRYRIRLSGGGATANNRGGGGGGFIVVQTKSKRFVHVDTHETDFVMSTHSIIVDDEEDNRMMLMAPDTLKDGQRQLLDRMDRPPRPCGIGHQFRRRHRHNNNLLLFFLLQYLRRTKSGNERRSSQ